ncbi:hypothetical protein ACFLYQ_00245 [Chloroflexota bacterium]
MKKHIALLVAFCVLGIPQIAQAEELPDGVISGQVVNETEGGMSVIGDNVTLVANIDGLQEEIQDSVIDAEGKFQFDGLNTEYQYMIIINHAEVDYYYQVIFAEDETEKSIDLQVYDGTNDDKTISIRLAHAIIYVEDEYFSISQVFWLVNNGDRIYVGEQEASEGTVAFTLPPGAMDFVAPMELSSSYILLPDGRIAYNEGFPPGERQLVYSYILERPDSGEYDLNLVVDYPTEEFHLMVEDKGIVVTSTNLSLEEPVETDDGQSYLYLAREGSIPGGTVIDVHISNSSTGGSAVIIVSVIVAVVAIGIISYFMYKERSNTASLKEKKSGSDAGIQEQKVKKSGSDAGIQEQKVKQDIKQLDDDFKQGLINEEMYRQLVDEKNGQLKNLKIPRKKESATDE